MYLKSMGGVELLTREGEIEIAKRIEDGRKKTIYSLCSSPLRCVSLSLYMMI